MFPTREQARRLQTGRERLYEWITRSKVNQREAAEILACDPVVLNQWLKGVRKPGLANALHIEHVTGISAESWLLTELSDDTEPDPVSDSKPPLTGR